MSTVPNASLPVLTEHGRMVALHRFSTGELWVVQQHPDGQWFTLREATPDDEQRFVDARASIRL